MMQTAAQNDKARQPTPAWTLSLDSRSRDLTGALVFLCILFAFFTPVMAKSGEQSAAAWDVESALDISKESALILRQRFPYVQSSLDLSRVLVSTSFKAASSSLRIEWVGDRWLVKGKAAPTIASIDFSLAPLSLMPALRSATSQWIGQVHTDELKAKIERDINQFLKQSGYRNAKTIVTAAAVDNQIEYRATLNIGPPCVIRGYLWPDTLPNVRLPLLDNGEICDESEAAQSVDEIEQKLHEKGWVLAALEFDGFLADDNQNIGYIRVGGSIGEKIVYEFVDPATGADVSNILTSTEMQLLEPKVSAPDSVTYEISHQLKNRGYSDVVVTGPEIKRNSPGVATYVFGVSRGEMYRFSSIQYEGNQFFSNNEMSSTFKIDTNSSNSEQPKMPPYSPDAVSEGIDAIKAKYIEAGFWDIKVSDRIVQNASADRHQIQLVITIEEGQRRLFDHVEITGATKLSQDEILELWNIKNGQAFDRSEILTFQQRIRTAYAARGYFYTTVNVELASETRSNQDIALTAKVVIDEGPRVRFGDIFVSGLVKTQANVVTREILFETGDWYDPELVKASTRALLSLGIFSSVIITAVDPVALSNRSEMMDMLIEVKEAPSRSVSFGPGWSSFYGMRYNVEGSLSNLGGTGRQLVSRASFDQEKSQYAIGPRTLVGRALSVGYLEPHVLDSPIDGRVSLSQAARSIDYAWSLTRGGEIEFSHTLRKVLPGSRIGAFYGRKLNEEESLDITKDAFLADTYGAGRLGLRLFIDHRDDFAWPTSGYTLSSELSWARYELGGDLRYYRWELGNNHYFSLTQNLVFAIGANFSAYQSVTRRNEDSADILPASERLNAGGSDSVRGYREKSLGPIVSRPDLDSNNNWNCRVKSSASGGSRRTLLKTELRYRWTSGFATSTFIDSGNTSFSDEEMAKFNKAFIYPRSVSNSGACPGVPNIRVLNNIGYEFSDLPTHPNYIWERHYTSTGLALNFLTPIGSINLIYGIPWHEPKSIECEEANDCQSQIPVTDGWLRRGRIDINVGAKF